MGRQLVDRSSGADLRFFFFVKHHYEYFKEKLELQSSGVDSVIRK
jgi:hypothetical protein